MQTDFVVRIIGAAAGLIGGLASAFVNAKTLVSLAATPTEETAQTATTDATVQNSEEV